MLLQSASAPSSHLYIKGDKLKLSSPSSSIPPSEWIVDKGGWLSDKQGRNLVIIGTPSRGKKARLQLVEPNGKTDVGKLWKLDESSRIVNGTGKLALDIYDAELPTLYLWAKNHSTNQQWTKVIPDPIDAASEEEKEEAEAENDFLLLHSVKGKTVDSFGVFGLFAEPNGFFNDPTFFSSSAWVAQKQRRAQPVMIFSQRDWKKLSRPENTHEGAFGRDFQVISDTQRKSGYNSKNGMVAVWKFPADMFGPPPGLPLTLIGVPLPVGEYGLWSDTWFKPAIEMISHPSLRIETAVEKNRILTPDGSYISYLVDHSGGEKLTMISSSIFIEEYWKVSSKEKARVNKICKALVEHASIYAIPVHGQHHAIVFYVDLLKNELLTPTRFATILKDTARRKNILHAMENRSSVSQWTKRYERFFNKT